MSVTETDREPDAPRATEPKAQVKETAARAHERVSSEVNSRLEQGKQSAAETVRSTAGALNDASSTLAADGQATLANATAALADSLSSLGRYVEDHSVDEFFQTAQRVARENPGLFIAGGMAIGLAMSRFLKASPESGRPFDSDERSSTDAFRGMSVSSEAPANYRNAYADSPTGDW